MSRNLDQKKTVTPSPTHIWAWTLSSCHQSFEPGTRLDPCSPLRIRSDLQPLASSQWYCSSSSPLQRRAVRRVHMRRCPMFRSAGPTGTNE
ncbi:hypothetical protein JVT61DRAFT_10025 [Boletus reticuloceps]|uniref:Uncharacterized protein n=1 Tax=Boletus reticuloceps TaxID=495285 RepID=A0A8I2YWM1_9AGAM|nr:hypothetical protein JVT61DRAFT_10025 [Boletus reticuloceps]